MAYELYILAAELGEVDAYYNVGYCLVMGKGVEEDYAKGVEMLKVAAENDHEAAKVLLNNLGEVW